jgi:hypothetical protein
MIRLKKDKRGASLSLNKLIILVLAALVIIGAFFVISVYGREILDFFKNQAEYPSGEDEKITQEDLERKIKKITVDGKDFYYDVNEFIKNKAKQITNLYLDQNLNKKAESTISKWGNIRRISEKEEERDYSMEVEKELIQKSSQNIDNFRNIPDFNEKFLQNEAIKLKNKIDNTDNKLGVDTGGDPLVYVYFKTNSKLGPSRNYVRFSDDDSAFLDYTPWILMDYWDEYRNFVRVPDWALLEVNN